MAPITEHTDELDGQPVFWRSAPGADGLPPVLYLHGTPTCSDDWLPFLERTGGVAPDMPGYGRSGKRGDLDFTMQGYGRWVERFLEHAGLDRVRLVVHDWGVVGLLWAMREPERVERLVVMDAVPLLAGYRWHAIARVWRTRGFGELLMGSTNRTTLKLLGRVPGLSSGPPDERLLDAILPYFDQGTQRAILHLYRTSPEDALAAAGADLHRITCPALVAWGDRDPYCPPRFAEQFAQALGGRARVLHEPGAGHWPWLDRPGIIDAVAAFLDGDDDGD